MAEHSFAKHLRDAREAAGITQLAHRTLLSHRQISDLETGRREPSWEEAVKLIEACGCRGCIMGGAGRFGRMADCASRPTEWLDIMEFGIRDEDRRQQAIAFVTCYRSNRPPTS